MKNFLKTLIPNNILRFKSILKERFYWHSVANKVKKKIIEEYKDCDVVSMPDGYSEIIKYLEHRPLQILCYGFVDNYNYADVKVYKDEFSNLKYTFFNNKKLYYKRSWSNLKIKKYHNYLLVEQDKRSPHKYIDENFDVCLDDIVIDAGAAEGIFSLSIVEKASKIYLFEPDSEWLEALNETFKPWKDKVQISPLFLGDIDNSAAVTLDTYFKNFQAVDFIKIDVEGHELSVLSGANSIMAFNNHIKIAVCTYHKQDDEILLRDILQEKKFKVEYSPGFVVFFYDTKIESPYFRKCLIRAQRHEI